MADKSIGDLPKAAALYDNDRMVLEQNGEAKHMEGRLLKDYVEPYASAAQSALEGVREAIENIPEGAATPIVNDLTTGGASMALSAEMGKRLKSDMDGLTYTDIDAAPAGYGLGAGARSAPDDDLNKCIANGWYWIGKGVANMPAGITYASVFVRTRLGGQITQYLYEHLGPNANCQMVRSTEDGGATWVEEWVNPPMQLGVEYRTTERSEGKPVYAKRIKYTPGVSITTGTQVSIPHEISGFDSLVRITGRANRYVFPYMNKNEQQSGVSEVTTEYIVFDCFGGTWSTNYNFYFNLYYTKTTD